MKWKSKFLCIHSLVLEVRGLKLGYIFKNRPFYISFVLYHFQACLNIPIKVFKKKKYPTYPIFFHDVT